MTKNNSQGINVVSKIPEITLLFWLIKIVATTLGETAGDAASMSLNLGYAVATLIFSIFFVVLVAAQIKSKSFDPFLYWGVIVATTTVGTTIADFMDRSLGVGYIGGSLTIFALLLSVIGLWYMSTGSISVSNINSRAGEIFYWLTILFSNTLGTALGDFAADSSGLGYEKGTMVFCSFLFLISCIYYFTNISRTILFWLAFILTRPLGATLGDMLTKPLDHGGLDLGRFSSSSVLSAFMVGLILLSLKKGKICNYLK